MFVQSVLNMHTDDSYVFWGFGRVERDIVVCIFEFMTGFAVDTSIPGFGFQMCSYVPHMTLKRWEQNN